MASIITPRVQQTALTTRVPFVPAFDLLDQQNQDLSEEEVLQIGMALQLLLPTLPGSQVSSSLWKSSARNESINRTDLGK